MHLAYYVPESLLGTLWVLIYPMLTPIPRSLVHYPHSVDEETQI